MSAYDTFLKETKSTPSGGTPKIVPPSIADRSQPAAPATSAYERFKQETSGGSVPAVVVEKKESPKASLYSRIQTKGQRIGGSFDAGILSGISGLARGFQWAGDRLAGALGANRAASNASRDAINQRMEEQTKILKLIDEKKKKGEDYSHLLEVVDSMKINPKDYAFTFDSSDEAKLTKAADKIQRWADVIKESNDITPENQTFIEKTFEGAGSSLPYYVPAIGVMRGASVLAQVSPRIAMLFGGSASAALESMAEAGQVYDTVKKEKGADAANEASIKTFWANALLLTLTENLGVFNPSVKGVLKKALISMPVEGFQESVQQVISNVQSDRPIWEGVKEAGTIGALIGGFLGGTTDFIQPDVSQETATPVQIKDGEELPPENAYKRFQKETAGVDLTKPAAEIQKQIEEAAKRGSIEARSEQEKSKAPKEVIAPKTPEKGVKTIKVPSLKAAKKLIEKEGGFSNAKSLPAVNAYAAEQLAKSLGLSEEFLYTNATKKDIQLRDFLQRLDREENPALRTKIGEELMENLTENVPQKKVKAKKEVADPLVKEAVKAKSVEEFISSQKVLYHGTDKSFRKFNNTLGRTWFSDSKKAVEGGNVGATGKGRIVERYLPKNLKLASEDYAAKTFTDQLIAEGYDGVLHTDSSGDFGNYYEIFDGNKTLTKKQLTDLYKKATLKKEEKLPKSGTIGASIGRFREDDNSKIILGNYDQVKPIEFPELVALAKDLSGSEIFIKNYKMANGMFYGKDARIGLNPDLFKKGNLGQLQKTMAHEIGHLIDYLPEKTLARGNVLGRLSVLRGFYKDFYAAAGATRTNKEVTDQLWQLSKYWKPVDEATAPKGFLSYRKSAPEIYADFISVLFNNPKLAGEMAPTAYNIFFEQLDAKPNVKAAYFELQDLLRNDEKVVKARKDKTQNMFIAADQISKDRQNQIELEEEQKKKSLWFLFKFQYSSRFESFREKVKEVQDKGGYVNPDDNPVYFLEESNYIGGKIKAEVDTRFNTIYQELQKDGMTWDDLGEITFYERILKGDRAEVANPEGLQIDFVQELYDGFEGVEADPETGEKGSVSMKSNLGEEKFAKLQQLAVQYRKQIKELYKQAHEEGLIPDKTWKMIEENDYYVPFKPIKYAGTKTTYRIKQQKGTLHAIENPANTGIEKSVSLIRAIEKNKVNRASIDFLKEFYPEDLQEAKYAFNGKARIALDPMDKNMRLVRYMEEGKMKAFYVDEYIGEALQKTPSGQSNMIIRGIRFMNSGLFRPLFITFNLGFQSFNVVRDAMRFWKNIPDMSLLKTLKLYSKSARGAKVRAFGLSKNPSKADLEAYDLINKLEEERVLSLTYNDVIKGEDVEDKQIDRIMREVGVREAQSTRLGRLGEKFGVSKKTPVIKQLIGILDFIEHTGNLIESMPKIAGYYALSGKLPPAEMRSFIRRKVGSPDFLDGGKFKPATNEIFLFANAIMQGIRSDYEVATQPKTRSGYWWKTMQVNIIPKLLMALAAAGLFGDELEKLFGKISEYDKTNYTTIPLGEDENGKAIYLRIPSDETGRLISGLFWKISSAVKDPEKLADAETYTNLLAYAGGQAPSLSPSITALFNVGAFISGQNPYDFFRARPVLTDEQMKAGGAEKWKPFLAYMFDNLGGATFTKLYKNETVPKNPSLSERIVALPIISNIAGRWIRVSNYGEIEQLRDITGEIDQKKARESLQNRRAVFEYVDLAQGKGYAEAQQIKREMIREIVGVKLDTPEKRDLKSSLENRFDKLLLRGSADVRVDALITAQSNEAKVALLKEFKENMSPKDFEELRKFIIKNRVVSSNAYQQFLREI